MRLCIDFYVQMMLAQGDAISSSTAGHVVGLVCVHKPWLDSTIAAGDCFVGEHVPNSPEMKMFK